MYKALCLEECEGVSATFVHCKPIALFSGKVTIDS